MNQETLKIIKDKDDYMNVVEIKENAKAEPQIAVKCRGDDIEEVVKRAILHYKKIQKELAQK